MAVSTTAPTAGLHRLLPKVHLTTWSQCPCCSELRSSGDTCTCCGTVLAAGSVLEGLFGGRWREVRWQLRLEQEWGCFDLTWLVVTRKGRVRVVHHHGKMACAV